MSSSRWLRTMREEKKIQLRRAIKCVYLLAINAMTSRKQQMINQRHQYWHTSGKWMYFANTVTMPTTKTNQPILQANSANLAKWWHREKKTRRYLIKNWGVDNRIKRARVRKQQQKKRVIESTIFTLIITNIYETFKPMQPTHTYKNNDKWKDKHRSEKKNWNMNFAECAKIQC